jgi:hypothetical protein
MNLEVGSIAAAWSFICQLMVILCMVLDYGVKYYLF